MRKNEMIIDEENVRFTLENDALERKPILFQLIRLLNVLDDNYTISIDGEWGIGKTFFIQQLMYLYIKNDNTCADTNNEVESLEYFRKKYIPIYYNAWENDDHENVLESLIYSILDVYPKYKKDISNKNQNFGKIVKPFLINLIDKGTFGFVNKEIFDNIETFEDLSKNVVTIEEQKEGLYKILDLLTDDDTRILLIIDELDRCKPDYAVKTLETIKHFYNYKKVSTLVVTNNNQLSQCIKHFYGERFDGYGYLNKMYDTVLSLDIKNLDDYLEQYLSFPNNSYISVEIAHLLITYLRFSLRECNSFVSMYNVSTKYIYMSDGFDKSAYIIPACIFLPIGLALKIKNIDEYNKYIKGNSDIFIKNFISYISTTNKGDKYITWLKSIFKVSDDGNLEECVIKNYHEIINQPKYSIDKYPIHEALSLLGNLVTYSDDKKIEDKNLE